MHEKYLEQLRLRYAAESALEEEKGKNQKLRAQLNRDYENSSIPFSKSLRPKFRMIVATVTTRIHKKANMPTHFVIYDNPAFKEASVVQLEQIRTIDKSRIDNYLGKVTPREMVAIEKALSVSLAMEQLKKRSPKHKAKRAKE